MLVRLNRLLLQSVKAHFHHAFAVRAWVVVQQPFYATHECDRVSFLLLSQASSALEMAQQYAAASMVDVCWVVSRKANENEYTRTWFHTNRPPHIILE